MNTGIYRILPGLIRSDDAREQLRDIALMVEAESPQDVIRQIARSYSMPVSYITGNCRREIICEARHLCMFIISERFRYGPTRTSRFFSHNHSSVIHALKKVVEYYETNKQFRQRVVKLVFKVVEFA
jgi:chromosomal replication initiation ATPase DnaA